MKKEQEAILQYITYFESEHISVCKWEIDESRSNGVIIPGPPCYSSEFKEFIRLISGSDLMDTEYMDHLEKWIESNEKIQDAIERADFGLLRAITTYAIRQERFRDGNWEAAANDGTFLRMFKRLRDVREQRY